MSTPAGLAEVARLFTWLGVSAFGGPAAHVAAMDDACVRQRRWLSRDAFADLVGATQVIPGPNSTELAMHLGYLRAGWSGFWVAGFCFIAPAVALVWMLAWGYVQFGARLEVQAALAGMQPVILAVVLQALWRLHRSLVRGWWAAGLGMLAFAGVVYGITETMIIGAAVLVGFLFGIVRHRRATQLYETGDTDGSGGGTGPGSADRGAMFGLAASSLFGHSAAAAAAATALSPGALALTFARIGSVLFGSGYVLLSFLRAEFVTRAGLLTDAQLLDAVAMGQVTPGPVFSTATFVGYLLAGHAGAAAATVGIFAPAFAAVAITAPFVARLRSHPILSTVLDAVNAVSFALMASVATFMAGGFRTAPASVAILVGATIVLTVTRIGSGWVLLGGAALGLIRLL